VGSGFRKTPCGRIAVALVYPFKGADHRASRRQQDRGDDRKTDNHNRGHEIRTRTLKAPNAGRHDRGNGQDTPSNNQRGKGHQLKGRPRPTWGDGRGFRYRGCQSGELTLLR
jgi:hypothetical protein